MSPLLEVIDLKVWFPVKGGLLRRTVGHIKAVDGISFRISPGTTTGLVGESGSGKSTTGLAIARLAPITAGQIVYDGQEITHLDRQGFFPYRRKIQVIFQDPFNSLNPRMTIAAIVTEPMEIHFPDRSPKEQRERAARLLERVGLRPDHLDRYPHEFSGGQRQRIG
ncbi:MAG: ATP-binding cassette domain-containing protein, partial [Candidatus Competibacteraceae bacterium]|nr:ATP-binding cassette domain-containing protein [Candidatus Competibacteraceae bacterium]